MVYGRGIALSWGTAASRYLGIPKVFDSIFVGGGAGICPEGEAFEGMNVGRGRKEDEPFLDRRWGLICPLTLETTRKAQEADVRENVLLCFHIRVS